MRSAISSEPEIDELAAAEFTQENGGIQQHEADGVASDRPQREDGLQIVTPSLVGVEQKQRAREEDELPEAVDHERRRASVHPDETPGETRQLADGVRSKDQPSIAGELEHEQHA